jgi:hypothetical protein
MSIYQLIYTSKPTPLMTEGVLLDILKKSQITNLESKLSGLLIFHNGTFMQLLEGEKKEVTELYKVIQNDPRHREVKIIFESVNPERCMPTWAMGLSMADHEADAISKQAFHIPIEVTRQICELMEGEAGRLFRQFLNT